MYIYVYIYICMNVWICAYICICVYIFVCLCIYISEYTYIYMYVYIYIYICIYWSRYGGTSGRIGKGSRQALWRAAAKSISRQHIFKYIGIYVCILVVAVYPAVR